MQRRRSQPHSFQDQIAAQKRRLEEELALTPQGQERNSILKKLRELDAVMHMSHWLKPARPKAQK